MDEKKNYNKFETFKLQLFISQIIYLYGENDRQSLGGDYGYGHSYK